jgi:Tol biopolymer transport system component
MATWETPMPRSTRKCALATAAALLVAAVLVTASAGAGGTGLGPKDQPSPLSISADGRCVAFASEARRLVPGDTNRCWDVFVYDSRTRQTERVSVSSKGEQANGNSWRPSVSGDGRYVAFESGATNLVPGDTNGHYDVFVRDRQTRRTTRASLGAQGAQGNDDSYVPSVSAGGRYVAFYSEASNLAPGEAGEHGDVFLHDGETGATERVSVTSTGGPAKGWSWYPAVSADGRYVAFSSTAPDLVAQDTNGQADVFVRDRQTGATERISVSSAGLQANGRSGFVSISGDGQYVAFDSDASNLVPGDTNGHLDVFVYDRRTRTTERVSVSSHGAQGHSASAHPSLSADGRYVAFSSYASNLVPDTWGIFVHDRRTGTTEHVSTMPERGHRYYEMPAISADGRYIAFLSETVDRGPGWSDSRWGVFVRDRRLSTAERIDRPGGRGVGSFLLRLLLYWRDDTGQWVPMPWHARLTLAAGLILLAWIAWDGIRQVRRGEKSGWHMVW